jgi:SecD/SecF fusion protein
MRENLRLKDPGPLRALLERSINEVLARSIYTSAAVFPALLPMAVAGGLAVSSFTIPMLRAEPKGA